MAFGIHITGLLTPKINPHIEIYEILGQKIQHLRETEGGGPD